MLVRIGRIVTLLRLELLRLERVGQNGHNSHFIKFGTIVRNAGPALRHLPNDHPELGDAWPRNYKLHKGPRITGDYRLLRFYYSLGELSHIRNVLNNVMNFVGPRLIVLAKLLRYSPNASIYPAEKPRLTGLRQIKGRSDRTYRRRVVIDNYNIRTQNVSLDIYILAATPAAVLHRSGAF